MVERLPQFSPKQCFDDETIGTFNPFGQKIQQLVFINNSISDGYKELIGQDTQTVMEELRILAQTKRLTIAEGEEGIKQVTEWALELGKYVRIKSKEELGCGA